MTSTTPDHPMASAHRHPSNGDPAKALLPFALLALGIGGSLLALSTIIKPEAPFMLASTVFGLVLPALFLTHREGGGAAVRALLRNCVRLPSSWWWLPLAAFTLPVATWTTGAATGGAVDLTWGLASFYLQDLIIGAVVINIWEEMAWTGFAQRRAMARWGQIRGSLLIAVLFAGIHLPLAFDGAKTSGDVAAGLGILVGTGVGLRLLIAGLHAWSGRSLLAVALLHAAFNATGGLVDPSSDWVRYVVTVLLGLAAVGVLTRSAARH